MQLGFVIDHGRCIGCHACTVACKSENDVPLGSFRTWVKYTETGSFPAASDGFPTARRHFAVLRCNQCSDAPCVSICPTAALEKRPDGIVDVDPANCIGCKSCMQGCPYDALYIHESKGTAEKCHFCAHRTERGLAPACAIVCPTEAIIPGDFDDPESAVSRLVSAGGLTARKTEAGTGPNVWYREVDDTAIQPLDTTNANGFLWANRNQGPQADAQLWEAMEEHASAGRTVYDVPRRSLWGWKVGAYLLTKSISGGAALAALPLLLAGVNHALELTAALLGLVFLALTAGLLVADLRRPERFLLILRRPQWGSWLVRGTVVLMVYGALLAAWLALGASGPLEAGAPRTALVLGTAAMGAFTACYTAFLFAQAKGRVLWMQRLLVLHLLWQALAAGAAALLVLAPVVGIEGAGPLRWALAAGLALHLVHAALAGRLAPPGRETEYARAHRLLSHGPYRARRVRDVFVLGGLAALLLVFVPSPAAWACAGLLALFGVWSEEDLLVRAGQALPIS